METLSEMYSHLELVHGHIIIDHHLLWLTMKHSLDPKISVRSESRVMPEEVHGDKYI